MEHKIMIDSLDTARLTCPECRRKKILQLSAYKLIKRHTRIKYRCTCGYTMVAVLVKQTKPGRETCLAGTFMAQEGRRRSCGKITIKKMNSNGVTLKTNIEQKIMPGFNLLLEFVLDDAKQSIVQKEVKVLARSGKYLTAEFTSKEHFDNLGPYLFFNKLYV